MMQVSSAIEPGVGRPPFGRPGCVSYALLIAAAGWVLLTTVLIQGPVWVIDNIRLDSTNGLSGWVWLAASWGQALLMGLVLVPLAWGTKWPRLRAVYRTWALAAGCGALLSLARIFSIMQGQQALASQALLAVLVALLLGILARARGRRMAAGLSLLPAALAVAGAVAWPALLWGALGSPLDAILGLIAGLGFGLVAGLLLAGWLFGPPGPEAAGQGQGRGDHALAVFGAATALFILGGAFGVRGSQSLMLITLPPLGIAISVLAVARRGNGGQPAGVTTAPAPWLPIAGLVGPVTAAQVMFWDPVELSLVLGPTDILGWALRAAELSLALAAVAGFALLALAPRLRGVPKGLENPQPAATAATPGRRVLLWSVAALALWAGAGLLYSTAGRPGFYGEQFFVILRDQADVHAATSIPDRTDRLRYVYTTLTQHAASTQARLRQVLDGRHVSYKPYYLVNGLQVDGGPLLRAYLAAQPEVDRIVDSQRLRPLPALPPAGRGDAAAPAKPAWNITMIGADRVWRELKVTGKGIVVGQSDSGVQGDHPALRDNYRGRGGGDDYNWLDPWFASSSPVDLGGHGTHTLGTAVGQGGIGVAPDAQWMACVNLARNLGNPGWYLNCMQFMLAPYPQGGDPFRDGDPARAPHVLNNSWGCPPVEGCDANTLTAAAGALRAAGIYVVASAGNGGPDCGTVADPIALYGDVLSVGAVDERGQLASFSSRGPVTADGSGRTKPDILAPGVDVLSAFPDSTYTTLGGTSMAGPHVAGVVALMWSAQPRLIGDIDRTTQILIQTAGPYRGRLDACARAGVPNNDAGYGVVDAYAAVKAALEMK